MPHPKVKISDDSGNTVDVTSNRLDVNAYLNATPTIDIGDVSLLLGGTAASTNAGTMDAQTLRVTLATDDTHWGTVGTAADVDGTAHGQLRHIGNSLGDLSTIVSHLNIAQSVLSFAASTTGSEYAEGDGGFLATGVRNDTLASLVSVDHDHAPFQVNASGALYVSSGSDHNANVIANGMAIFGEAKIIDGSALPNIVAEGTNARLAVTRSGIAYACLTDDAGASDLGTTITTHLSEIEGAVETIEAAVDTQMQVDVVGALPSGSNNIGDVDVASLPASTNTIEVVGDVAENENAAGNPVLIGGRYDSSARTLGNTDIGALALNASGHVIMDVVDGGVLESLLDGIEGTQGTIATNSSQLSAIAASLALLDNSIASGNELQVDVVAALPAGTNAIGKLAANSGVDIGDVDVTSISAGTNAIGKVGHDITGMVSGVNSTISDSIAEQLDGSTSGLDIACKRVDLMATQSNTGDIWVGDSGVTNNGAGGGMQLNPGDFYSIDVNNLNDIWVIATVDEENIHYMYFT